MKRSEIREAVFLLLFRAEFNKSDEMPAQMDMFFEAAEDDISVKITDHDKDEIVERVSAIVDKIPDLDKMISEKATGWTPERMGKVDLTIIRLAVYEINFDDTIPVGVSINEAVELAKKYGREESGAFVNGVLAKFAK